MKSPIQVKTRASTVQETVNDPAIQELDGNFPREPL